MGEIEIDNWLSEVELDNWFFSLPACTQMDITGIYFDEYNAIDEAYDAFDDAVADWWDELFYGEKEYIYAQVELGL